MRHGYQGNPRAGAPIGRPGDEGKNPFVCAQGSQIGNSVILTPTHLRQGVIQWGGDPDCTEVITLDIGAEIDFGEAGEEIVPTICPLADIEWGIGDGAIYRATVDIKNGTQLSFPANRLNVTVFVESLTAFFNFATIKISVGALRGTRPSRGVVTRTIQTTTTAGGQFPVQIPNFAYAVQVMPIGGPFGNPFDIQFWTFAPGGNVVKAIFNYGDGSFAPPWMVAAEDDGIKIPNCAEFMIIEPTNDDIFTSVFLLDL